QADIDDERAGRDPLPEGHPVAVFTERLLAGERGKDHDHGHRPTHDDEPDRDPVSLLAEPAADDGGDEEADDRQQRDERDERVVAHWRIESYSSTSGVRRFRKMAMTIASPTVASPAATAMTISAMTDAWPTSAGLNAPKARIERFTEFSIS